MPSSKSVERGLELVTVSFTFLGQSILSEIFKAVFYLQSNMSKQRTMEQVIQV